MYKKAPSRKLPLAIILIVILIISAAAIVYATQFSQSSGTIKVGVHIGDTFTYRLTGESVLGSVDAVTPPGFSIYNDTDHYTVTVTKINGTQVSLETLWQLTNGTQTASSQTIDLANGNKTDMNGFWALYPSNLNVGDLLSPKGYDEQIVNQTDTQTYGTITRERNFWHIENVFTDVNDPTGNTMRDDYIGIYFDRQTGMLTTLTNIQYYNNPQYNLIITWQLVGTNVWTLQ